MIDTSTIPENKVITDINEITDDGVYIISVLNENTGKLISVGLSSDAQVNKYGNIGQLESYKIAKLNLQQAEESTAMSDINYYIRFHKTVDNTFKIIYANGNITFTSMFAAETYGHYIHKLKEDYRNITPCVQLEYNQQSDADKCPFINNTYGLYYSPGYKIKVTRINSTSVTVSASIKLGTRCFPFGVRLLDSQKNDFKIYTYKEINGTVYKNDLTNLGVPRDTGFVIEYIGSTTKSTVNANFIIDDSVGSPLTDTILIGATAEREGFAKRELYSLALDDDGKAKWIISDLTCIPAQRASLIAKKYNNDFVAEWIDNENLVNTEGSVSNKLLQSSGSIIPLESMIEKAKTEEEKQKVINYASWHVTKAIDNASFLTSLSGIKDKTGDDSILIASIKNVTK